MNIKIFHLKKQQTGIAIVLAMGVVAMAALAATAMLVLQSTWARQAELTDSHAQAQLLMLGGLGWARAILSDDLANSTVDYVGEPWSLRLPPVPVENGTLTGYIEDQQGKFNLNNLLDNDKVSSVQLANFQRLLTSLSLSPALANTLADWLDADNEPQPAGGAEDAEYLSSPTPYLAANRALIDVAELALVRGFDDGTRTRLRPFITALPRLTAVNVNTASPEVLAATIEGLSLDNARAIVAKRERSFFRDMNDFSSQLPAGIATSNDNLSVNSQYFFAEMTVTIGEAQAQGSALLARDNNGWPSIIWHKTL